jgi:hypothetical protein
MTNLGFNPIAVALSFIEGIQKATAWRYLQTKDKAGVPTEDSVTTDDPRDKNGKYTTDGLSSVGTRVSMSKEGAGKGRGSCVVDLNGEQIREASDALSAWDPEAEPEEVSIAEAINRTIKTEKDGTITFALSLAKNTRRVQIPAAEWDNYLGYMKACADSVPQAVEHFRGLVAKVEAEQAATADEPSE